MKFDRSPLRRCGYTHLLFAPEFFYECGHTPLGLAFVNVSSRAKNGRYHKSYSRHHTDLYTRAATAIEMDSTWVHNPTKFGLDILLALGMPVRRGKAKLTLDRINNNEGYFIGNLRWATYLEQARNRGRGELTAWHGTENERTF
jgi:hypothetical protein